MSITQTEPLGYLKQTETLHLRAKCNVNLYDFKMKGKKENCITLDIK